MSVNFSNANININDKKKEVLDLIEVVKVFCFNFPTVDINTSLPSFKSDFDVIDFLLDMISTILGKKATEVELLVSKFLIDRIEPLEKTIRFNIKSQIKSCYACKINPRIPDWLFVTNPVTGNPGNGLNIPIKDFDWTCLLKINPSSDVGRTLYSGPSDMNQFLYDVIQAGGTPLNYLDPITGKHVATFTFVLNGATTGTTGNPQTGNFKNNIINIKIPNSYNAPNKNIIDFINDYLNTFLLFNTPKVITQSMDLIYGVLTRRVNIDTKCKEDSEEVDEILDKMSKCGLDDPNIEIDDSFFEFSSKEITNIKSRAKEKQNGTKTYFGCESTPSSIDFNTILQVNDDLENATDKATKVEIIREGIAGISETSSNNVTNDSDKNHSKWEFISQLIRALKFVIFKLTLSPKVLYLIISMWKLLGKTISINRIRDWFSELWCVIREVFKSIMEEIVRFLMILVLRGLKLLIKKFIKYKLREKIEDFVKLKLSFLPNVQGCGPLGNLLSDPFALAYTGVDAGFDQVENAVVNKNKSQNSG